MRTLPTPMHAVAPAGGREAVPWEAVGAGVGAPPPYPPHPGSLLPYVRLSLSRQVKKGWETDADGHYKKKKGVMPPKKEMSDLP